MRGSVALLLVALVLVTGVLPRHRCTPAGCDGPASTVFLGAHAHDGPCDHGDDGHGHDSDGAPCCVDTPADPTAPPSRAGFDVAQPVQVFVGVAADRAMSRSAPSKSTWHVPIQRPPTETVVLLR